MGRTGWAKCARSVDLNGRFRVLCGVLALGGLLGHAARRSDLRRGRDCRRFRPQQVSLIDPRRERLICGASVETFTGHRSRTTREPRTARVGFPDRTPTERPILLDMKLLLFVKGSDDVVEVLEDFPCDVALQAADYLSFGLAFDAAAFDVVPGSGVGSHADEHDPPECFVR